MKKKDIKDNNVVLPLKNGAVQYLEKYAIIETGGKQYFALAGKNIVIEKLDYKEGDEVRFTDVLFIKDGDKYTLGNPYIANKEVVGKLIKQIRGDKIIVFKFKRRKKYRKKQGHRQSQSVVKIVSI
jgi:large subunit ribosomal protein L21